MVFPVILHEKVHFVPSSGLVIPEGIGLSPEFKEYQIFQDPSHVSRKVQSEIIMHPLVDEIEFPGINLSFPHRFRIQLNKKSEEDILNPCPQVLQEILIRTSKS
jgi:hypothetical protein